MGTPEKAVAPPVTITWRDVATLPIQFADFLHWRAAHDRFYLTIGQLDLPIVEGPLPSTTSIEVRPIVRLAITPETLRLWANLLQQAASEIANPAETPR